MRRCSSALHAASIYNVRRATQAAPSGDARRGAPGVGEHRARLAVDLDGARGGRADPGEAAQRLNEIWEYGHSINPRLDEAIAAPAASEPVRVELTLTLTADVDELNEELARLEQELFG